MKAVRLKTEYLQDPLGIDIPHPRLFWTCEDGITQSAFQILAATDGRTVWDSGKVPPAPCTRIIQTRLLPGSASAGACGSGMRTTIPARGRARPFSKWGF